MGAGLNFNYWSLTNKDVFMNAQTKQYLLGCVIAVSVASALSADSIQSPQLQEQRVQAQREAIARGVRNNTLMRYGLKGLALTAACFGAYVWYVKRAQDALLDVAGAEFSESGFAQLRDLAASLSEKVTTLEFAVEYPKFNTLAWWKRSCQSVGTQLGITAAATGIWQTGNLSLKIFNKRDLEWFVTNHTKVGMVLQQLIDHAITFDDEDLPEVKRSYTLETLPLLVPTLIGHLEAIDGFMRYKASKFKEIDQSLATRADKLADYLFECSNDFCKQAHSCISGQADETVCLSVIVDTFIGEFQRIIGEFAGIEVLVQGLSDGAVVNASPATE